jgi:hypothetical protein
MVRRYVWLSFGLLGLGLWAGCTQPVSQAYAPVPTPTPVPVDAPFVSEPKPLPTDLSLIPKIDEAIVPGGSGRTIPLYEGFLSTGTDSQPAPFYVFQADDATRSLATTPTTNLNRVTAAWDLYRRDGSPLAGQKRILSAVPGEPGYFPYVQVHAVTVPDTVQANDIRDHRTILRGLGNPGTGFSETVPPQAVNTVVVGENAVLQGNEGRKPQLAWFDGRRAYIHTFDSQPVRADGTVTMNPMAAPQPTLVGRPAGYDRALELPTIVPFFHQTTTGKVLTDAILEVAPGTTANPSAAPAPTPTPQASGSPTPTSPTVTTQAYSGLKSLSYFKAPDGYRFRSITTKAGIPDLNNLPRARYWLNAPAPTTLTSP